MMSEDIGPERGLGAETPGVSQSVLDAQDETNRLTIRRRGRWGKKPCLPAGIKESGRDSSDPRVYACDGGVFCEPVLARPRRPLGLASTVYTPVGRMSHEPT